ncbi:MAG: hypothetical protein NT120_00370 [Candidatus Aenigmarchaeota archaeon]|nr:hypothetical protein [Candidatus Aenigmarchaeota archaeon]
MNIQEASRFAYRLRKDMADVGIKSHGAWSSISGKTYLISNLGPVKPLAVVDYSGDEFAIRFSADLKNEQDKIEDIMKRYPAASMEFEDS